MSDITLPKEQTNLFGHVAEQDQILSDFERGKLAHGWIIGGPRGIGKATLAYRIARAVLGGREAIDNSGHPVFRRIAAGSHSDLMVIEPEFDAKKGEFANEISAEQAREIPQFLSLTPGEGDWRVVIVDAADALNITSANAILKILEEPPPQALLLLVSHTPGKLLATIRSRCRMLSLRPPGAEDFNHIMRQFVPEESEETLFALADMTEFSPGLALECLAAGAVEQYNALAVLLSGLPAVDTAALSAMAEQFSGSGIHAQWRLTTRLALCLLSRVAKLASGLAVSPVSAEEEGALAHLSGLHPASVWAAKWQQCHDQFLLAQARHLDYKQAFIIWAHSLASREAFALTG